MSLGWNSEVINETTENRCNLHEIFRKFKIQTDIFFLQKNKSVITLDVISLRYKALDAHLKRQSFFEVTILSLKLQLKVQSFK